MNQQSTTFINPRSNEGTKADRRQFSTFYVAGRLYGVDVSKVQEVVRPLPTTKIPLSEQFVQGLINLRGQVVTAISLHRLFGLPDSPQKELMNVICKVDSALVSLLVDEIGDVVELECALSEPVPSTMPDGVRKFMMRVHRIGDQLLSIIDVEKINQVVNG